MLISRKLPLAAAILTVVSIAASSIGGLMISSNALTLEYDEKLSAIADGRRNQIETYLESTRKDIEEIAVTPNVAAALNLFGIGLTMVKEGMEDEFMSLMTDQTLGHQEKVDQSTPSGARVYLNHEGKFGPVFDKIAQENDFEDIFLINTDGRVVFTLLKKDDFNVNINDDAWKDTALARIFEKAIAMGNTQGVAFLDYGPYATGRRPLTAFVAKPVVGRQKSC